MAGYKNYADSSYMGRHEMNKFPNPWLDMASMVMPTEPRQVLDLCEFLFLRNPVFKQAAVRCAAYFITDLRFESGVANKKISDDEIEKNKAYFTETLDIPGAEMLMSLDTMCYGNSFVSVIDSFKWMVGCRRKGCGTRYALKEVSDQKNTATYGWRWSAMAPHLRCRKCGYSGEFDMIHMPDDREDRIKFRFWPPQEIDIDHDLGTGRNIYWWRIPPEYERQIRFGRPWQLENCRPEWFDAIKRGQKRFRFAPNKIFHAHEPTISGYRARGWGLSRTFANAPQLWMINLFHRHNEAFALDYVMPFRVVSPASAGKGGATMEPGMAHNIGQFVSDFNRLNRRRRFEPTNWHAFPYPINYQVLGGEAKQLMTPELLQAEYDRLMDGIGAPVELQKQSLQVETLPVSMRIFEASFQFMVHTNNRFVRWAAEEVSSILRWQRVVPTHERVRHADDMQKMMAVLQMASGGNVSLRTALGMLGIDSRMEQRFIMEDAKYMQELQKRQQESDDKESIGDQIAMSGSPLIALTQGQQQQGAAGVQQGPGGAQNFAGAAGMAPGTDQVGQIIQQARTTTDPSILWELAHQLAQLLLNSSPQQRAQGLAQAQQAVPTLHASAKEIMEQQRRQAASQGREQNMSQAYGPQAVG